MEQYEQLGERLRLIRERLGLSRAHVARELGLQSREGLVAYESGRVRLPLLLVPELARVFDMPKLTLARALGIVEDAEAPSFEQWFMERQRGAATLPPPPVYKPRSAWHSRGPINNEDAYSKRDADADSAPADTSKQNLEPPKENLSSGFMHPRAHAPAARTARQMLSA